jgi:hypothetical protein
MYWFVEHKKFVVFVLATLILLFIEYHFFIANIQEETVNLRENQNKLKTDIENRVKKGIFIRDKSIQNAEEELKFMENDFSSLNNKIHFRPSSGYQSPTIKRPDDLILNFQSLLKEVQKRFEKNSAQKGISIPAKLDFPLTNVSTETITSYYERLDMIEQMVNLAMVSNCQKIIGWGVTETDFKDFKDVKEIVIKTSSAIKNMAFIKIQTNFTALMHMINMLRRPDRFISLEKLIIENSNPDVDSFVVTFVVASIKLSEKGK